MLSDIGVLRLVSALQQYSSGLGQIMHLPSAHALSSPQLLLYCPHTLNTAMDKDLILMYLTMSCAYRMAENFHMVQIFTFFVACW